MTNKDGYAFFRHVPHELYRFQAKAEGYSQLRGEIGLERRPQGTFRIALRAPIRLKVRVEGCPPGKSVGSLSLLVRRAGAREITTLATKTDPIPDADSVVHGTAEICDPGHYAITIVAESWKWSVDDFLVADGADAEIVVQRPTGATVRGRVVDDQDSVVFASAIEWVREGDGLVRRQSVDREGRFQVEVVPPGEYRAVVDLDSKRLEVPGDTFTVTDRDLDDVVLRLQGGRVSGRLAGSQGRPDAVVIYRRARSDDDVDFERVDARGEFTTPRLCPGRWRFVAGVLDAEDVTESGVAIEIVVGDVGDVKGVEIPPIQ